jgi:hypothetical protein
MTFRYYRSVGATLPGAELSHGVRSGMVKDAGAAGG